MKRLKSLFLLMIGRGHLLSTVKKLLLCLLIPVGMLLIIGCETEDLSKESLVISEIKLAPVTVDVEKVATLMAMVVYSGNCRDLSYDWWTNGGRVDNNGKNATYVAPKTANTYTITFEVSNGSVVRTQTINVEVVKPTPPMDSPNNVGDAGAKDGEEQE